MSIDDLAYNVERLQELRRRDKYIDAVYRSAGIVGIGTSFYMGWWIYHFFTDANISLRNSLGEAIPVDFPPVNPWLKSPEARTAYMECLRKEYGGVVDADAVKPGPSDVYVPYVPPPEVPNTVPGGGSGGGGGGTRTRATSTGQPDFRRYDKDGKLILGNI